MSMTEETERSKENKEEAGKTTKTPKYNYLTYSGYQAFLNEEHTGDNLVNFQGKVVRYLPEGKTREEYDRLFKEGKANDYATPICQHLVYLTSDKKYHPVEKAEKVGGYELDNIIEQKLFKVINETSGIDIVKRESGNYCLRILVLQDGKPKLQSKNHEYGISRAQARLPNDADILKVIVESINGIIAELQPLQDATESIKDVDPKVATQKEEERKELVDGAVA